MSDPLSESSDSDHAHFASIPWCAQHLQGPNVVTGRPTCRNSKDNGEDNLFAVTLKSPDTISAVLQVFQTSSPTSRVDHVKAFFTLGPGLNGHPGISHGGIVATILDEVVGLLVPINQQRGTLPKGSYMTAYLNIQYLKPVPTSSTILARAKFAKIKGRKYFAEGSMEDENGTILARADALYIGLKSNL